MATPASSKSPDLLPYGRHLIEDDDIEAVVSVLRGDWLTQGPVVEAFESALADAVGAKYAVSCSSGTAALHLAAMAAGIGPGDAVVVPANTFLATANVVRMCGGEVVFADIDPDTGLMTAAHAEAAIGKAKDLQIRAVMPVHFAGQCASPSDLADLATTYDLTIIEDACHALGTTYTTDGKSLTVGSCAHAHMATFSFHPVKTIAMGEGGAVTTNDDTLARRLRDGRNHGLTREAERLMDRTRGFDSAGEPHPWYYEMHEPGLNYRASSLHCALGVSQLGKLDRFVDAWRSLAPHYDQRLAVSDNSIRPLARTPDCDPAWHLYVVRIDFTTIGVERGEVMKRLRTQGIGSQVHYIPVPWQPFYDQGNSPEDFPGAADYYGHCLSLPLFPSMTTADVDRVVDTLETILEPSS